ILSPLPRHNTSLTFIFSQTWPDLMLSLDASSGVFSLSFLFQLAPVELLIPLEGEADDSGCRRR
ncbi:hypothetical protein, partial [Salmonella enterica]|uniref:hypothetical protein n=1 Tax=Salmonella enterica TaxID=28901 RepID=UPI001EE84A90